MNATAIETGALPGPAIPSRRRPQCESPPTSAPSGLNEQIQNVLGLMKRWVYSANALEPEKGVCREIDHLIALELGGLKQSRRSGRHWMECQRPQSVIALSYRLWRKVPPGKTITKACFCDDDLISRLDETSKLNSASTVRVRPFSPHWSNTHFLVDSQY